MKNLFFVIKNNLCNYVQRLAMISSFVAIAVSVAASSSWEKTATMTVGMVTGTGNGTVYVSTDKSASSGESSASSKVTNENTSATFYLFATPDSEDYSFAGWYTDVNGTKPATLTGTTSPTGKGDVHKLTSSGSNVNATFYAKFKAVWEYNIVFKATSGGTYTVTHTRDVGCSHTISSSDWRADDINSKAALNFTLKASPSTGNQFLRWVIKDTDNGKTTYNYTNPPSGFLYTFASSSEVYAEFIPEGSAMFCLLGNESVLYLKLSEAISAAAGGSNNVIVLHRSGELYPEVESTTYYDAGANKYTIPSNVTLLIPNSENIADYKVHMDVLTTDQISTASFSEKKLLKIEDGQDIDVYGKMCIYATVKVNTAAVCAYGRLHLGEGSDITLKSGANLNALGYITGHENSSVIAESGATVRELLQIADWRGGNALATIAKAADNHKAFPICQYYVQNIETKLRLCNGAIEYLTSFMKIASFDIPVSGILIAPQNGDYNAMFRTGSNTVITKYYDKSTDRQKFDVEATAPSSVSLDNVTLDLAQGNSLLQTGIYLYLGTTKISSADYVLPINNNMDIHVKSNLTVDVTKDVALLAGSILRVDKGATLQTTSGASIYVYDAKQHHVQYCDATIEQGITATNGKVTDTSIRQNYYYNYFGSGSAAIGKVSNRPGGVQYNRSTKDLVSWTNPSDTTNKTSLQVKDAQLILNGTFKGAIYTTKDSASIISDDPTANATLTFSNLSTPSIKQIIQKAYNTSAGGDQEQKVLYPSIPCLSSAALKNPDGTYSAGGIDESNATYTYYPTWDNGANKSKGRWAKSLPEGEIVSTEINGNAIELFVPEVKVSSITFKPQIDESFSVLSIKTVIFSGSRFASNGSAKYENGLATIPYTYTHTTTHGDNITIDNSEKVTIVFICKNVIGENVEKSVSIDLTATQNYQPDFRVNESIEEVITLNFGDVYVYKQSAEQTITINPVEGNVTDRNNNNGEGYVTWTPTALSLSSPFVIVSGENYFDGLNVVYKPTTTAETNADGYHTQTFTVKAKYSDGVEMTKTIVLKGKPMLASNPLQFVDDKEIYPNEVIDPLFFSTGNGTDISYTYNGAETSAIVEIVKSGNNYKLQVKSDANIIAKQEIVIRASQIENEQTFSGSDEIKVTITPTVQWNWSKLYFGAEYDNAVDVIGEAEYEVTYSGGCATIPAANFVEGTDDDPDKRYSVSVGTGDECTATFVVKHEGVSYTFTSEVYADPRILDMCVSDKNAARTFEDISVVKTNVKYDDGILFATTEESGAAWTMEIVGVPNEMQFIPHGEGKKWTIVESDGVNETTTRSEAEIVLAEGQTHFVHKLKASTKQIRIICSLGAEQGKITDLCVYALDASVSANVEKVYIPIVKDENGTVTQSQESVVLSYVSPSSDLKLSVVDGSDNVVSLFKLSGDNLNNDKLPATNVTDENNLYRVETTIVVSSTYATEGTVYLLVKDKLDEEKLRLPIRLYHYPQPLPMRSADWKDANAEKYYFYTDFTRSQNVQYDAVTQKISFASLGSDDMQFVTFVFQGGPNYIEFETQLEMTPTEWYDYWSLQVTDGITNRLVAENVDAEVQPVITTIMRGGVTYYKVHVDIPYTTKSLSLHTQRVVSIENIVIDGEPDLDVVLGNHTIEHEGVVNFTPNKFEQNVEVTAINLEQLKIACNNEHFTVKHGDTKISSTPTTPTTLTARECPNVLGNYMVGNIALNVEWDRKNVVEEGVLIFTDKNGEELATIRLLGAKDYILKDNSAETGLFTGFAENITTHPFVDVDSKYEYVRRQVDLSNTFDKNGVALFDYLIVYGETTAEDLGNTINAPTTAKGSNANTPIYVYRKMKNEQGVYDRYQFVFEQANVNEGEKVALHTEMDVVLDGEQQIATQSIPHAKETAGTRYINIAGGEQLRVYMTGFCPYASTGFDKAQEGVWLFRGKKNAKLDVYLEDCHIYSRNKTEDGHSYNGKNDPGASIFQEDYARGSGGVLVFECNQEGEYLDSEAFQVTIHTRGRNLLKSNYGCFYEILGMRAYQVSSPVQIRLTNNQFYEQNSKTHLTFDDKWLTDVTDITQFTRTNGFLSLQKQANNAPSIDMGNGNTVVNFRGGQVELQNAQNVSDKYKTTLAISYRSGIMAAGGVEIQMAYGIGTDAATEGTVNFYDGTITVIPMEVDAKDRKYYLMDTEPVVDENGNPVVDSEDNPILRELTTTSCLRCPEHTYVYGGSICMLRACMSPTSQGGAPTDGVSPLGRFVYTEEHGYEYNTLDKSKPTNHNNPIQWLVNPVEFPSNTELFEGLANYHKNEAGYTYGIESVTPNEKGQLTFWIPDGFGGVKAEDDRYLTTWKACMPEITAVLAEVGITKVGGTVGGETGVSNIEDVENLLYCQLDDKIYEVISATNGTGENKKYVYEAPLKIPEGFKMDGVDLGLGDYMRLAPSSVGEQNEHQMINEEDYNINSKVYYVTSATADNWMTFTAPFNVEKMWVVETFDETALSRIVVDENDEQGTTKRSKILKTQATHNADFASFFGVAMALGSEKTFEQIYEDYIAWAMIEDKYEGEREDYTIRGKHPLIPYNGSNWNKANFYLYRNDGNWKINFAQIGGTEFSPNWKIPPFEEGQPIILSQGETYSMLFPYCVGCELDENGNQKTDENGDPIVRDYWDYWSGKLIIFESTQASKEQPHVIRGSNFVAQRKPEKGDWVFQSEDIVDVENASEVVVTGNSTFANMTTAREDVFIYTPTINSEAFYPFEGDENDEETIYPTTAFLYGKVPTPEGASVKSISRMGKINYATTGDNNEDDVETGGHMPTVGDGSDIFVTATAEGIRVAVEEPQYVGVFAANGALIFNGWVENSVNVALMNKGVYVVVGENVSVKVIY